MDRSVKSGYGFHLDHDTAVVCFGKCQVIFDGQNSLADGQMIAALGGKCIVQVHMAKPLDMTVYDRTLCKIAGGIVTGIKGDGEHGTFKQTGKGFLTNRMGKRACVFNADANIAVTDGTGTGIAERTQTGYVIVAVFLKQINLAVGQREIRAEGQVHIQNRDG